MSSEGHDAGGGRTPAGWYTVEDGTQRYWDGTQWTQHVAPAASAPAQSPAPFTPNAPGAMDGVSSEDRTMAMLAHLLALIGGFIAPLIVWLVKRDQSAYIDYHGKEALNFQLSMLLYYIVSFVLAFVLIGLLLIPVLIVLGIVLPIIGGLAANRGEQYKYPLTIRFIS